MTNLGVIVMWSVPVILLGSAYFLLRRMAAGRRGLDRLFAETGAAEEPLQGDVAAAGPLRRWLFLAGYRQPSAPSAFVAAEFAMVVLGISLVYILYQTGLIGQAERTIELLPSGIGDLFLPLVFWAPWVVFLMLLALPWLIVRRARRDRTEKVEQDLPLSLELLATLSEAGLGFDAALARLLDSVRDDRPLPRELRTYQADLLAGRTRVESFRRLARRLDISSASIIVSALVQAEQLGSGIAQALRRQADDLRDRRRERANAFAMALPVKRMFPLVICFMPGIFVWTLGPFFVQLFQIADKFMHVRNM